MQAAVGRLSAAMQERLRESGRINQPEKLLGEFLLALACERAAAQGVHADMCLRHGSLVEALESAAREEGADAIAFGRPAGIESSFALADLQRLAARIEEDAGVKTYIL